MHNKGRAALLACAGMLTSPFGWIRFLCWRSHTKQSALTEDIEASAGVAGAASPHHAMADHWMEGQAAVESSTAKTTSMRRKGCKDIGEQTHGRAHESKRTHGSGSMQ